MWCCMYVVADNDAAIVVPEQERRKEPKVYRPKYEIESSMKLAKKNRDTRRGMLRMAVLT